jgi:nucleotide-binding universal stress UspA family protein
MMYNIKKILVPVDLSEASLHALGTAVELAKRKKCLLQILSVEDNSLDFYPRYESSLQHNGGSDDILTALVTSINKTHGIKPEVLFEKGSIYNTILKKAYRQKSDLIVLGTHGASGYRNDFIGSVTYNVVKYSNSPVLIVPPNKEINTFKKILFPVRPVAKALAAYDILCHFLTAGSKIEIAALAYQMQEKTGLLDTLVSDIADKLTADNVNVHVSWAFGNAIAENILSAITQLKVDLLVMTSAADVTPKPFFIGPHTQEILHNVRIPVLCIKQPGNPSLA